MSKQLKVLPQYLLPKHTLTKLCGKLADVEKPGIKNFLIKQFIGQYKVDMSLAAEPDYTKYHTFNEFFTRPLRDDVRPVCPGSELLASPVDGKISQYGPITGGRIIQAKGHDFSAAELLGGKVSNVEPYLDGEFMTIYLAPKDYHRIHMPVAGKLISMHYVPGALFSVNQLTAATVPNLFARNERVVCHFETAIGAVAMVLVGATIVGSIETSWHGTVTPLERSTPASWDYSEQAIELEKGAEMGRFKLGSTVVMLFEKDQVTWDKGVQLGRVTEMGERLAQLGS